MRTVRVLTSLNTEKLVTIRDDQLPDFGRNILGGHKIPLTQTHRTEEYQCICQPWTTQWREVSRFYWMQEFLVRAANYSPIKEITEYTKSKEGINRTLRKK
jgi:hypothetical protein